MKLYLVQHAEAFTKEEYADRPLTEKGCIDAQKIADHIKHLQLSIEIIWHSGKTRAMQTAKIFHAAVQTMKPLQVRKGLSPNDDPAAILDDIDAMKNDLMIVGHLPFLSRLAGLLLSGRADNEPIAFQKAGIVCLGRSEQNTWQLCWMLTPDLL